MAAGEIAVRTKRSISRGERVMCLFCAVRGKTIREMRQEIRELERLIRDHEKQTGNCVCGAKALKHPERKYYFREYYQANREKRLAQAKERYRRANSATNNSAIG